MKKKMIQIKTPWSRFFYLLYRCLQRHSEWFLPPKDDIGKPVFSAVLSVKIFEHPQYLVYGKMNSIGQDKKCVLEYEYDVFDKNVKERRDGKLFKTWCYDTQNRLSYIDIGGANGKTLRYAPIYKQDKGPWDEKQEEVVGLSLSGIFSETVTRGVQQRSKRYALSTEGGELLALARTQLSDNEITETKYVLGNPIGTDMYVYDGRGNLIQQSICDGEKRKTVRTYEYDRNNRLVGECDILAGRRLIYEYEKAGQLTTKTEFDINDKAFLQPFNRISYTYEQVNGSKRLVGCGEKSIIYDAQGRVINYLGRSLEWENGEKPVTCGCDYFAYDDKGRRTRKNDVVYAWDGDVVLSECWNGAITRYYYGEYGVVAFEYCDKCYYYQKNLMGDITAVYDAAGNEYGRYSYDAFGNCRVEYNMNGIAEINPFRYRGFYWDRKSEWYCVDSGYYDPKFGVVLNADGLTPFRVNLGQGIRQESTLSKKENIFLENFLFNY